MTYVLRCSLASKKLGRDSYFRCMTAIGCMHTQDLDAAEKFETKQDAMQSPAYASAMNFFEPLELDK